MRGCTFGHFQGVRVPGHRPWGDATCSSVWGVKFLLQALRSLWKELFSSINQHFELILSVFTHHHSVSEERCSEASERDSARPGTWQAVWPWASHLKLKLRVPARVTTRSLLPISSHHRGRNWSMRGDWFVDWFNSSSSLFLPGLSNQPLITTWAQQPSYIHQPDHFHQQSSCRGGGEKKEKGALCVSNPLNTDF